MILFSFYFILFYCPTTFRKDATQTEVQTNTHSFTHTCDELLYMYRVLDRETRRYCLIFSSTNLEAARPDVSPPSEAWGGFLSLCCLCKSHTSPFCCPYSQNSCCYEPAHPRQGVSLGREQGASP